ncbi:hypothetical protein SAMN05421812_102482 [Asanoa hainanensis]|uniref:DUF1449 family protein n=1 Tax=Asanoa hainanensis TaxID=560556 RepID=A0A239IRP2_9ACTN|nr:hypothetical protein [Asanoa hainanensis]SNS95084.1 hypothetical protein SAMN05421812_102482 [Asanoa hainanensis]
MGDFIDTALGFPSVVFTVLLAVVVCYWIVVLAGGLDTETDGGLDGILDRLGLGGTPATVVLSIVVAVAWFASLVGTVLLPDNAFLDILVLIASLAVAWAAANQLRRPLRRFFPTAPEASRHDFVGRECVIRTGRVGVDFGQAEVHAADGSSAIVQVRQTGADTFALGTRAVIYDYDSAGEFFWVVPADLSNRSKDR